MAPGVDAGMMRPVALLCRAMERYAIGTCPDVFSSEALTIVENFPPFIFEGATARERWWRRFIAHASNGRLTELRVSFGTPQDFERSGGRVFFTLPTVWTGKAAGRHFVERGGWAFILVRESNAWRIRSYAWAMTSYKNRQ